MTAEPHVPQGVDPSVPSPARIYDYVLGGSYNFESDRTAASRAMQRVPEVRDIIFATRGFHGRAVRWIAEQGITQYLDIGSGLPTVGNTHEIVGRIHPDARVMYVDND
ncbi:MAG: SAM-dependent methyltransferase, partial [Streptosporangiaceae bacterium]